ncbi:MAG TPA: hypothetical protein VFC03_13190 [Acidimicrobiales bacterium]|nr:hypothetical protein [Acidimicrobiales bacterium]
MIERVRAFCGTALNGRWKGVYSNQQGVLIVPHIGTTACFVEALDTAYGVTRVNIRAPILLQLKESPELYGVVAFSNVNHSFGAIMLTIENDLANLDFDYSILGEDVTAERLNFFVEYVVRTSVQLAHELRPAFGGRTVYEA